MADDSPVHLAVPLAFHGSRFATVPQDSDADVTQCVAAIVRTPLGYLLHLPEFGLPSQVHRRGGADLPEIERTLALWEDRLDLVAFRGSGSLQELADGLDRVQIAPAD